MRFRLAALAALVSVSVVAGLAQAPVPAGGQPTFRAGVTLVTTDVIPRDDQGRFVSDLTRENFTVLEDEQPQTIASFSMVHGGRTYNLLAPPPAQRALPEGLVLPQSTRPRVDDTAGRAILIFIDDLHFEPEMSHHVRKLLQTIGDNLIHDGDMVMIVSSGPSFIEHRADLRQEADDGGHHQDPRLGADPGGDLQVARNLARPGGRAGAGADGVLHRLQHARPLERVNNKRKAVIYISQGYDFDPFAEGRNSRDRVQGGRFSDPTRYLINEDNPFFKLGAITADIDLHQLMRELTLSANRANATLYTIDPRGLAGVVDAGTYLDQSEWRTYIQKTTSTLRYMAEQTGGFAIVNTNDFASDLKRVDSETSDYYVIGFYSTNPDPTKRTRLLDVKVDRPNVTVASRREYSLKTEGTPPAPPALKKK